MAEKLMTMIESNDANCIIAVSGKELMAFVDSLNKKAAEKAEEIYQQRLSEEFYTRQEMMTKYKLSDAVLYKWSRMGYLVPLKMGGKALYRKSDVERILEDAALS